VLGVIYCFVPDSVVPVAQLWQLSGKVRVADVTLQPTDPKAEGHLVDTDPLLVAWSYAGTDETVEVALRNLESGQETTRMRCSLHSGQITFERDHYLPILTHRHLTENNRIRAVVYTN
jgi:hypothetical protein